MLEAISVACEIKSELSTAKHAKLPRTTLRIVLLLSCGLGRLELAKQNVSSIITVDTVRGHLCTYWILNAICKKEGSPAQVYSFIFFIV